MKLNRTKYWLKKARKVIPNATQVLSKGQTQYVEGMCPAFIKLAYDSIIIDLDNNQYIDFTGSLGPVILGYNNQAVDSAIKNQLNRGISLPLPTILEVKLAEKLNKIIKCSEMVRFVKNGSDSTSAAIKIARAYTDKYGVLTSGYHGNYELFVGTTERNRGVVEDTFVDTFEYNNIEQLRELFEESKELDYHEQYAAVIMEPMSIAFPKKDYLQQVRKLCDDYEVLLIFDEVVTGFRWSLGGAQECFDVIPDIACFGKAIGNGMPLSCVVGKEEIMRDTEDVFISYTFGGETLSLAAALETINFIEKNNVIEHIYRQGRKIQRLYNQTAITLGLNTRCLGMPQHSLFKFDDLHTKSIFIQEMAKRGILTNCINNIMYSHTDEDIEKTNDAIVAVLEGIYYGRFELEGREVSEIFRKL